MTVARCTAVLGLFLVEGCAVASVGASRYLASGGRDLAAYQVARESPLVGPIGYELLGVFRPGGSAGAGWMAGVGTDLTVLAGSAESPYLIGGVQAGIGTREQPGTWASWSLGVGVQLLELGPIGLRGEGRYRKLSAGSREGLEIGVRIGRGWRGSAPSSATARPRGAAPPPVLAVPSGVAVPRPGDADETRRAVVGIATEAMGTPYRWGGTGADGFDCSGLIQFAYGEVGIALPRRSADQALLGSAIGKQLPDLLPGDILTFATAAPGVVSHVGLYLGEGKFIHSATGGVQVSVLSATDPYGRWWWQRWLGARRIVR